MKRYLKKPVLEDLKQKMVFIGGPRQVGKTTLSLDIAPKKHRYLNWDILEDREFILRQKFPVDRFVIFGIQIKEKWILLLQIKNSLLWL